MDLANLETVLQGEPPLRLRQAEEMVFKNLIDDWSQATNLPLHLRERLNQKCPLSINAEILSSSKKDVLKALFTLKDSMKIESVLMRHSGGRNTVCVSCQIGCPIGCVFCATGEMGFKRNLKPLEIVEQVLLFARYLKKHEEKVTNIVFMGMGEPFLNYENVMEAIRIVNKKEGLNIGSRHISISTVGIVEGIEKLTKEPLQVNMAISLHAPNDSLRSKLIPANKKYPIQAIMEAVHQYILKRNRRVMFEYIMIDGLNDSDSHAKELAALIKNLPNQLSFVNLVRYNPTGIFKPSPAMRMKKFKALLESEGIAVTERYRFGQSLKGACGQLGLTKQMRSLCSADAKGYVAISIL